MKTIEFQAQLNADRMIAVPTNVAEQVPAGQTFRVVIMLDESPNEELAWSRMAAMEFLKGFALGDEVYDSPA